MDKFPKKLQQKLLERVANNTLRTLPFTHSLVDFSSNDYLGFGMSSSIFNGALQVLEEKNIVKNGATGSRLISGNSDLHLQVEAYLAEIYAVEAALLFNSGYDANIGFFGAVPQRSDYVFYDEFIHASIRDGISMSAAKGYKFKHNDLNDLKAILARLQSDFSGDTNIYVVTESVFSMDGDSPDLELFKDFCTEENYYLVVDEAHAIGVFGENGEGKLNELGIQDRVFASVVTFGKALGGHGAAILGSRRLKDYLINFARSFIYTTALPPHALATILVTYQQLLTTCNAKGGESRRKKLMDNIKFFNQQLSNLNLESFFIPSTSAIHSCIIPGNRNVKAIAKELQETGFDVKAIVSPTVPQGKERLRFCLHSYNSFNEISAVLSIVSNLILQE